MFSGLSEYLFGSGSSTALGQSSAMEDRQGDPIQETETDDDWVLVDVTNESDSPSPRRSPRRMAAKDGFQSRPQPIPSKPHRMEESWFITPPPCFTAGGHSPQQLATSPMEDLLIEHPSMSVYHQPSQRGVVTRRQLHHHHHHNHRPKPTRTVAKRSHNLRVRNTKPPRRATVVAARVGIEQSANVAAVQEQQQARRHQQRLVSRSKLERHNKAHHQQSASSRRHYRHNSLSSGRHSGAIYKQPR